jgi:predicted transcriptional regulator
MNTAEYLDLARERLGLPSDYALQKPLGVSKSQLSAYRTGKESMSDGIAIKLAELCKINAGQVILDMHVERSKNPEVRAVWVDMLARFTLASEKISESFLNLLLGYGPHVA